MASGCTNIGGTASVLFQKLTPDTKIQYTGIPYPQFGICTGDLLSEVEASILQQIVDFSNGKGITLSDIDLTTCDCFTDKVSCCGKESCQTLICILEAYLECLCALYADVETLKTEVTTLTTKVSTMYDGPYDVKCLTGVTSASKLPAILQETITELCALATAVSTITSTLNISIGNFLSTAIRSCQTDAVKKTGTGASFAVTFSGMSPIGTIQMYGGPISGVFDGTGLGYSPGPACGWALCNGAIQNGIQTVDMRGYFPVGVNDGSMGGGSQNSEVNNSLNPGQNYGLSGHGGEVRHLLTPSESGSGAHTHTINDPGHSHIISVNLDSASGSNNSNYMKFDTTSYTNTLDGVADVGNIHAKIRNNTTGITINSDSGTPAGAAHENRPPYRAIYFIQRVA